MATWEGPGYSTQYHTHKFASCHALRSLAFTQPITSLYLTLDVFFFPSRLIPPLIGFLAEHLAVDHRKLLLRYQGLVQKRLGLTREREEHSGKTLHYGNKETEEQAEVAAQLDVLLPDIKDIALSKKTATVVVES